MQNSRLQCTTTTIDAGAPSYDLGWQCFQVKFHNFETLPAIIDQPVEPPIVFQCFGCNWILRIHPGGMTGSGDGHVIITWSQISGPSIDINFKCYATKLRGHDLNIQVKTVTFDSDQATQKIQLQKRQTIINNTENGGGTLTFSLYMKEAGVQNLPSPLFVPTNPCSQAILKMFGDEKSADILFEISDSENGNGPTRFYAHRFILQACASYLADLCDGYTNLTPVPINDIKPEIFRAILRYVYGEEVSSELLEEKSKDIICAADMYALSNLKVEAEAAYVKSTPITVENMVDNFYFADTKQCALLKEKVMEFLVEKGLEVLNKVSFKDASMLSQLFHDFATAKAMQESGDKHYDGDIPVKFKTMSVDALRRKLSGRGLGIDGTREMMVAALEGSYAESGEKQKRDENDTADN